MSKKSYNGYSVLPKVKLSKIHFEECKERYGTRRSENDDFFIFAESELNDDKCSVAYHLFDFKGNKGIRGVHLTISTFPNIEESISRAVHVSTGDHLLPVSYFCTHSPSLIVGAIRTIERKELMNKKHLFPLFSERIDWQFFYYGLMFELDKLK